MGSLLKTVHGIYFENTGRDDKALGRELMKSTSKQLEELSRNLSNGTIQLPCANVIYNNLVSNPIETVKEIYKQHDWHFSGNYEQILIDYINANKLERESMKVVRSSGAALHTYSPEEFGLTEAELSAGEFAAYVQHLNIPMSRN